MQVHASTSTNTNGLLDTFETALRKGRNTPERKGHPSRLSTMTVPGTWFAFWDGSFLPCRVVRGGAETRAGGGAPPGPICRMAFPGTRDILRLTGPSWDVGDAPRRIQDSFAAGPPA